MDAKTLMCKQCHKTFTPDQLVLTTDNEETAFCGEGFEFHDFDDLDGSVGTNSHTDECPADALQAFQ